MHLVKVYIGRAHRAAPRRAALPEVMRFYLCVFHSKSVLFRDENSFTARVNPFAPSAYFFVICNTAERAVLQPWLPTVPCDYDFSYLAHRRRKWGKSGVVLSNSPRCGAAHEKFKFLSE